MDGRVWMDQSIGADHRRLIAVPETTCNMDAEVRYR